MKNIIKKIGIIRGTAVLSCSPLYAKENVALYIGDWISISNTIV